MEHPFLSKRNVIRELRHAEQCIADMHVLADALQPADRACILERRDADVRNPGVRAVLSRHAADLGLLHHVVHAACEAHGIAVVGAREDWVAFLKGERPDFKVAATMTEGIARVVGALVQVECTDEASSESDYSDADTSTSSEHSGESDDEEEEESDEDAEEDSDEDSTSE